jgi:hypothetical protein
LTNFAFEQPIFDEKQYDCNYEGMSLENSEVVVDYQSKEMLYSDLIKNVDLKTLSKLQGEIMIQLLVDKEGKPCCISISNNTNVSRNKLRLVKNVNSMTGWQKTDAVNKKVCAIINLNFMADRIFLKGLASVQAGSLLNWTHLRFLDKCNKMKDKIDYE